MANPQHYTLVASTVKTFDLDDDYKEIEVYVVAASAATDPVYFTVNGAAPTVAGDGCQVVGGAAGSALQVPSQQDDSPTIKVISAGTPKVSVRGL